MLVWILVAGFFAVALHPLVNWLQWRARWMPRWLGTRLADDFPKLVADVLLVVGVPYAGLIALFVGLVDLIPLVGATLGAIVAAIPALVHSLLAGIVVIVFFRDERRNRHVMEPQQRQPT